MDIKRSINTFIMMNIHMLEIAIDLVKIITYYNKLIPK